MQRERESEKRPHLYNIKQYFVRIIREEEKLYLINLIQYKQIAYCSLY